MRAKGLGVRGQGSGVRGKGLGCELVAARLEAEAREARLLRVRGPG